MRQSTRSAPPKGARRGTFYVAICLIFGGFLAVATSSCHPQRPDPPNPVAIGAPGEASQKSSEARSMLIGAVEELGLSYDEAACTEREEFAEGSNIDHATSEAMLEVRRSLEQARQETEEDADGDDEADGIVMFEDRAPKRAEHGGWHCMQADEEPRCAHAAASSVSKRLYDYYIDEYEMNPTTAGDTMEAFAAEIEWGTEALVDAQSPQAALEQIEQECREDDSPIVHFFEAAEDFGHPEVRSDIGRLRDDFVGDRDGVCQALPRFYEGLMGELRAEMDRRTRTDRCRAPDWDPVWD